MNGGRELGAFCYWFVSPLYNDESQKTVFVAGAADRPDSGTPLLRSAPAEADPVSGSQIDSPEPL